MDISNNKPVLLFDGVCNLCNGWVNYVIDHDPESHIRFAPLQSRAGEKLLEAHGLDSEKPDSVVLLDRDNRVYERSDAVLRVAAYLKGLPRLLRMGVMVPRTLRNLIYDLVARNRYRWFGRRDQCRMPDPGLKDRFLEMSDQTREEEEGG